MFRIKYILIYLVKFVYLCKSFFILFLFYCFIRCVSLSTRHCSCVKTNIRIIIFIPCFSYFRDNRPRERFPTLNHWFVKNLYHTLFLFYLHPYSIIYTNHTIYVCRLFTIKHNCLFMQKILMIKICLIK